MLANLLPTFIPFFFVAILWILHRQCRNDDRIRWWICAWLFRSTTLLTLLPFGSPRALLSLHFLATLGGLAANLCCILSAPALRKDTRQIYWGALGLGLPSLAFTTFVFFGNGSHWPLYLLLALGCCGAVVAVRRFRTGQHNRIVTLSLCALSCVPAIHAISQGALIHALYDLGNLMVLITILVFWRNYPQRTAGLYVTLTGFAIWILSSPPAIQLLQHPFFSGTAIVGERLIGIGMVIILVQESLRRAHQASNDLEALFAQSPHMMWVIDRQTLALSRANQAAADAHGYSLEEFRTLQMQDIAQPDMQENHQEGLYPRPAPLHLRKDGSSFPIHVEARDVRIDGKEQRLIMGVDVTEREALLRQLAYDSSHDYLTGLYSRKGLMLREDELFGENIRKGKGLSLAAISLRHFKAINDTYGDRVGDRCLQTLAQRIQSFLRPCDIAARTSGDHFKVLFGEITHTEEAECLASRLLATLTEPVTIDGISIRIRISIGFATAPDDAMDMAKLRSRAQTAMWEARKLGVSHVLHFHPENKTAEANALHIMAAMEQMLENDTFEVYYQPVCRANGDVVGMEALLRMNDPMLGSISPAVFIPIAEETGLIIPLGQWVLERVCKQINRWQQRGLPVFPVAVNISGLQFRQSDFSSRIISTLAFYQLPTRLIQLELTESTVLRNISDALEEMQKLSAQGLRFSIDDFGTGYSSLGRLQQMPISTLKIDRSFITGITEDTSLMVAAIISLAHALGMKVIAEGVEDETELQVLRHLDCDLIQGFIFCRPLSPDILEPLLSAGRCTLTAKHAVLQSKASQDHRSSLPPAVPKQSS